MKDVNANMRREKKDNELVCKYKLELQRNVEKNCSIAVN